MRVNFFSQSGDMSSGLSQGAVINVNAPLTLSGNPVGPLEAAPKQYVDIATTNLNAVNIKGGTLAVGRLPAFTGDVVSSTGSGVFNLSPTGVTLGNYTKVTVNSKGRIVGTSAIGNDDIPVVSWSKITSDKPTTLSGYGITDAISSSGGTLDSVITLNNEPVNGLHAVNKQYVDGRVGGSTPLQVGNVVRKSQSTTPIGFLRCNGGEVSKTEYSALYSVLMKDLTSTININYTSYNTLGAGQYYQQQYDFNDNNTDITGWVNTNNNLPVTIYYGGVVATKSKVYIIGGSGGATGKRIYVANINTDGSLGTWSDSGVGIPITISEPVIFVTKNKVYMIAKTAETWVATIDSYGVMSNFSNTINPIPTPQGGLYTGSAVVIKNKVYFFESDYIYTANIDATGTLSSWTVYRTMTNTEQFIGNCSVAVTKNKIYVFPVGNITGKTIYFDINSDGTLGVTNIGPTLPYNIVNTSVVVSKNRVYLIGGSYGSTYLNTVYMATIDSNGTIASFNNIGTLPYYIGMSHHVVIGNYVYLIGGAISGTPTAAVHRGTLATSNPIVDYSKFYDGSINKFDGSDISGNIVTQQGTADYNQPTGGRPWENQHYFNTADISSLNWSSAPSLPSVRGMVEAAVTKNRVYLFGGDTGNASTTSIYTAPIDNSGIIGTWTGASISLPYAVQSYGVIASNNRIYIIGGQATGGPINKVCSLELNSSGEIVNSRIETSLPFALTDTQCVKINNRIYIVGHSGKVYYSIVKYDGTLSSWYEYGTFPVSLSAGRVVIIGNKLYVIGGYSTNTSSYQSKIYVATINTDGSLGAWAESSIILPTVNSRFNVFVIKNMLYIIGGWTGGSSPYSIAEVYKATINADNTITAFSSANSLPISKSHGALAVTSSRVYVLGGVTSSGTRVATVYQAIITGGLNDYSPYYDGTIVTTDPANFNLPDLSNLESFSDYYFIKY